MNKWKFRKDKRVRNGIKNIWHINKDHGNSFETGQTPLNNCLLFSWWSDRLRITNNETDNCLKKDNSERERAIH